MNAESIATRPFDDQRAGTAGLRKTVQTVRQPGYLENYLQSLFECLPDLRGGTLLIGGDGRFHNDVAIATAVRIAVANGVGHLIIGRGGLLSTPAASNLMRVTGADAGLVLTASHNPAGPDGDFGLKISVRGGGQAPTALTDAIFERSRTIEAYRICPDVTVDIDTVGSARVGEVVVDVVDPVDAYADLMQTLFDFDRIRDWLQSGHRVVFDAMHAVTGPYAQRILGESLGVPAGDLLNCQPLNDFGGGHPDPNLRHAAHLVDLVYGPNPPDLAAASDGDGDRNMILGPGHFVSPGDSLAMLAANLTRCPGYRDGISGIARSMPTSRAADAVAESLGVACYETPTGWKYFANLLDAGRITICGEESFGTSSSHTREKDGLWAVLAWMNLLADSGQSVPGLAASHWARHGRHYYQRHDYEDLDAAAADAVTAGLRSRLDSLAPPQQIGAALTQADDFAYTDPIDGARAEHQGLRLVFGDHARIILRKSGTGTGGATLRLYLERYEPASGTLDADAARHLAPIAAAAEELLGLAKRTGRDAPTLIT